MQRKIVTVSHRIVEDHDSHLVNQPGLNLIDKCKKTAVENKVSTVRYTNKQMQNKVKILES